MIILVILLKYLYDHFLIPNVPSAWTQAVKNGKVTKSIENVEKQVPG